MLNFTKPFNLDVLKVRIQNFINQRINLQQFYKKAMPVEFKEETVNQFEINFMIKMNNEVEKNTSRRNLTYTNMPKK